MSRPLASWFGFVGQDKIVTSLKKHCAGSIRRETPLLHILLGGPSGIGKTHLARSTAKEMGTEIVEFYASRSSKRIDLCRRLQELEKSGDILFIDEGHALSDDCQEILYPAIDRLEMPAIVMDGSKEKLSSDEWVQIPPFTLILATDQHGRLKNALDQRLQLKLTLGWYPVREMRQIVANRAAEKNILLNEQARTRLAQAARGTPRRAGHLLTSIHCLVSDADMPLTRPKVDAILRDDLGIDGQNLTAEDHRYLGALRGSGGSMSITNLAMVMGMDEIAVRRDIEAYLIRQQFIAVGSNGRFLTDTGRALGAGRRCA